jgi:hypothetical protein
LVSPPWRTDRHTATDGGYPPDRIRVAVQVHVIPAQVTGLLRADPDRKAEHYIGVKTGVPGDVEKPERLLQRQ